MRNLPVLLLLTLGAAVACSSGPSLTVSNTSVDAIYSCPPGASDAAYDLHATADVHNTTSSTVTINSITAVLTLEASKGAWQEKIGDSYNAGSAKFTPATVAAGATTTVQVTIASACTNSKAGNGGKDYGDYAVTLHIATSAGTFSDTSKNMHRILAA